MRRYFNSLPFLPFFLAFIFIFSQMSYFLWNNKGHGVSNLCLHTLNLANFRMENEYFYVIVIKRINSLFCHRLSPVTAKTKAAALPSEPGNETRIEVQMAKLLCLTRFQLC